MEKSNIEFFDMKPRLADFRQDVLEGLARNPKKIPPKFFYDEKGSRLFESITETEEYYVTRTEEEILRACSEEISSSIGENRYIIEYGSGNSNKTRTLIRSLKNPAAYALIDISNDAVQRSAERLSTEFPDLKIISICADYLRMGEIPDIPGRPQRVIVFLGSTIGNFEPDNAGKFLDLCAHDMNEGEGLLVGVDMKKDAEVLNRAYNDSKGYTADFNLNLLWRIKRELRTDLDPATFFHRAYYNEEAGRIEMHLVSTVDQDVMVENRTFHFREGESIHTENSYKYSVEEFTTLVNSSGLRIDKVWKDPRSYFGLFYLKK